MVKDDIQNYPTSDSPNHDAFEGIVELYFEIKGYITSSGKWFWKKTAGKQQRGYQDIDVLAINGKETIIVSVSSNFDDKLNFTGKELNKEKSAKTLEYFDKVSKYLTNTKEYSWLTNNRRTIKKVIAFVNAPKNIGKYKEFLEINRIEILSFSDMKTGINEYLKKHKNFQIQNQSLKIFQILES